MHILTSAFKGSTVWLTPSHDTHGMLGRRSRYTQTSLPRFARPPALGLRPLRCFSYRGLLFRDKFEVVSSRSC